MVQVAASPSSVLEQHIADLSGRRPPVLAVMAEDPDPAQANFNSHFFLPQSHELKSVPSSA